jgi:hypothetical protein
MPHRCTPARWHPTTPNNQTDCLVYLPLDPTNREQMLRPRAVLCFRHGSRESVPLDIHQAMEMHGAPASHLVQGADHLSDILLICPQLPRQRRWNEADDGQLIRQIVDTTKWLC